MMQTQPATRESDTDGQAPATILAVDDQPANIQVLGGVLGKLGHEVIPAQDGPTALRKLALRAPDLILLDYLMPEMDGCEICSQIRKNPALRDIPIIFLSAADDKDFIVRALDAGGVDYVTKPFHHAELISRVNTQLALKRARDRLRWLAEDKDELLGILAHDLKNHLGGMQMSAQLLSQAILIGKGSEVRATQLAENISHTSGQLLAFVKELLANAAADHSILIKPRTLSLADAAVVAVRQYAEAAHRKNLTVHTQIAPSETEVFADPTAVNQVLDNLLSNALKFSKSGREIFVTVKVAGSFVECIVRDQGPGFTAEDRARMFQRYGRLSARPTNGEPSTGLGLSIVQKLVRAMDGELICESTFGEGATFIVRLPKPRHN